MPYGGEARTIEQLDSTAPHRLCRRQSCLQIKDDLDLDLEREASQQSRPNLVKNPISFIPILPYRPDGRTCVALVCVAFARAWWHAWAGTEHYLPTSTSSPNHLLELEPRPRAYFFQLTGSSRPASNVLPLLRSRVWLAAQLPNPASLSCHTHHTSHSLLVGRSQSQSQNRTALWLASHPPVTSQSQLWLAGLPAA